MKRKVVNILLCIAALAPVLLSGCRSAKLSDADEQYARGEYHAAMLTYKKIYNKLTRREERQQRGVVAFRLGECYRHLNMAANASGAYRNALRYNYPDSMALLYLAQSQHMEGKYKEAIKSYEQFLEKAPKNVLARDGLRGSQNAARIKANPTRYKVAAAKLFNSRRADFCPMFFDAAHDVLYFTSSTEKSKGTAKSEVTGTKNSDIYFSKKNEKGVWQRPEAVDGELNTDFAQ